MKEIFITVKTQFAGMHFWKDAPSEVAFLKNLHRHIFYIVVDIPVTHKDRQLEFFILKNHIDKIISNWHETDLTKGMIYLGSRSCEMIADYLLEKLKKDLKIESWIQVTVSEDNENSGTVYWKAD